MKLAFIGMGNMASALAGGFLRAGKLRRDEIVAFDPNTAGLAAKAAEFGFLTAKTAADAARDADAVLIACKPYQVEAALHSLSGVLGGKALLSIALGWDHARYRALLPDDVRVQFIMPNTPALVGSGVFLFEETNTLLPAERAALLDLFGALGTVMTLPTAQMGIGGAISGCGPAFVDLMIEAYADAAVLYGVSRDTALRLVSATIEGSAKLQKETGKNPEVLKDMVCSPGGSTIRGVTALEKAGFRAACISSIEAIMKTHN